MPNIDPVPFDGLVSPAKLAKQVALLVSHRTPADAVIALTDVRPQFTSAAQAKQRMREWVGQEPRFHPHAAHQEFEAWLPPYWPSIQKLARHNKSSPGPNPEFVDRPAKRIEEIFELGKARDSYNKLRDANRLLTGQDLSVAIAACPELKSFVNTILRLSAAPELP